MKHFDRLWKGLQQEGKVFIFFVVLLTIFRIVFLGIFANTLADVKFHDIWMTLWYGFRISLKTIGVICLVPFVVATLVQTFRATWPAQAIRRIWYSLATIVMTLLFIIRIPYYHIFESGYNLMLVNGAHDDIGAIINTAINEYHAIPYLIVAIIACAILGKVINKILSKEPISWEPKNPGQLWVRTGEVTILLVIFAIFCRWGGAFSYTHSINWENATRMSSTLLNETILDDAQALYRVRTIHKRMQQFHKVDLTEEQLKEKIVALGGKPAGTIDESFKHTIDKEKLPIQPQTVTFILGESYGLWPMLPQYASFGDYVAHEGKSLTQKGMSADYLLAQGTGTMPAVNGFLTGMPDVGLFPNYEPTSYQASYGRALVIRLSSGMGALGLGRMLNALSCLKTLTSSTMLLTLTIKGVMLGARLIRIFLRVSKPIRRPIREKKYLTSSSPRLTILLIIWIWLKRALIKVSWVLFQMILATSQIPSKKLVPSGMRTIRWVNL